jgi:hypothetical protein
MSKTQVIVSVLGGGGEAAIREYSSELHKVGKKRGHSSTLIPIHAIKDGNRTKVKQREINQLADAFGNLKQDSRIYLDGHGDWVNGTLSGVAASAMVDLIAVQARMPEVRIVSILGCSLGRDTDSAADHRITGSLNSFAAQFHRGLKANGNRSDVYARVYDTFSGSDVASHLGHQNVEDASKFTGDSVADAIFGHGRKQSKYRFFWEGDTQRYEAVDYSEHIFRKQKGGMSDQYDSK